MSFLMTHHVKYIIAWFCNDLLSNTCWIHFTVVGIMRFRKYEEDILLVP